MTHHILWLVERLHEDGAWEAIDCSDKAHTDYEDALLLAGKGLGPSPSLDDPRLRFGDQDFRWFAILTGRNAAPARRTWLAREGSPENRSELSWPARRHGSPTAYWFTLGEMRAAAADDPRGICLNEQDAKRMRARLAALEVIAPTRDILVGPETDDDGRRWPSMRDLSAHEQMTRKARAVGLLPVDEGTVRVIVAYED